MQITDVRNTVQGLGGHAPPASGALEGPSFSTVLKEAISRVNQLQLDADAQLEKLAIGQVTDVHDVTIALQKASLALSLTIAVRNKLLEAYQQIERMQI